MGALVRFLLDAFYTVCFFVVTLALATGADRLVVMMDRAQIDGDIVGMVRWLARGLVAFDIIGVACASGVSLFRFVRALAKEASNDGKLK